MSPGASPVTDGALAQRPAFDPQDDLAPPAAIERALRSVNWDFADARTDEETHAVHPYPAKFIPQIPRQIIELASHPGEIVLDPFAGGGTTAVEALLLGRAYVGIDANPVANLVTRVKTTPLSAAAHGAISRFLEALLPGAAPGMAPSSELWLPDIPNLAKWYDAEIFGLLARLRQLVAGIEQRDARALVMLAFVHTASRCSHQESETRYVSKPRRLEPGQVLASLGAEVSRMQTIVRRLSRLRLARSLRIFEADSRAADAFDDVEDVGLIVTSPPYPNAYDYHLYHRFRLFWLGDDPRALRSVEIGSHLTGQSKAEPGEEYLADMSLVLTHCHSALRAGRYAALVVGDGIYRGELFQTASELRPLAVQAGFEHVATFNRNLPDTRRSVTSAGRRLAQEQIVVLRRPSRRRGIAVPAAYGLYPYEEQLLQRELAALGGSPAELAGDLVVCESPHLAKAAFAHAVVAGDEVMPTHQAGLERAERGRRKNSTYLTHGIHRFKGKFYPQLAKSLLNVSGLVPGESLVLDPFAGSGTVAAEAALLGVDSYSIDCNPVAHAIARAKFAGLSMASETVEELLPRFEAVAAKSPGGSAVVTQFDPETLDELERWFPLPVLRKVDALLAVARSHEREDIVALCEVLVSDIIRDVSQQEPKDLRIRRRREPLADAPVYELFLARARDVATKLELVPVVDRAVDLLGSATFVLGDSAERDAYAALDGRSVDAIVSSPPYAAALPYIDTDRLSLAAVFGFESKRRRGIEATMIGSREISGRELRERDALIRDEDPYSLPLPAAVRTFLNDYRAAIDGCSTAGFRLQQAPAVLARYFLAMANVLEAAALHLRRGAHVWLVVGDSRSVIGGEDWRIPTIDSIVAIGNARALEFVERIPITVTREDRLHSRNSITANEILHFRAGARRAGRA